jgi:uncharacterized protein (DUF2336 family)
MLMTTNLAFLNEVDESIASGTADRREQIARRTIDLFIVGADRYSEDEIALFDDVLMRLAVQIETSARAMLAVRLAPIGNAPPNLIRSLAFDDAIDVAGPVLKRSERLDDSTLVKNAREKSQEHLLAISQRRTLSEAITDVLVERGDQQIVLSTARNRGARFSGAGYRKLVQRSEGDDLLAESVGLRPDIPPQLFNILLAKASKKVQAKLEAAFPHAKGEVRQAVADAANRIREDSLAAPDPAAAWASVENLHKSGQLDSEKVETFAKSGWLEETTAALALLCALPYAFVANAMSEERAETVLVLLKAAELPWSTAKAILELRAAKRPAATNGMAQSLAHFERLRSVTAQEIVRFYQRREGRGASGPN